MKTVSQILSDAADLIEPDGRWTQGAFALDEFGSEPDHFIVHPSAVCWCANGAVAEADGKPLDGCWALPAALEFQKFLGVNGIAGWNDAPERTQAEVVAALRKAARQAAEASR